MRREDELALGRRLLQHRADGTTYVADASWRNPVSAYLDETRWRAEHTLLFRRHPVAVATTGAIRHPGDWVTFDLPSLPLVTVRGDDGTARVFVNACRHRGVEVCQGPSGHDRRLVCPFHAWTYDTAGRLDNVPDGGAVPDIDPATLGLRCLPSAEHLGLVWLLPEPAGPAGTPTPGTGAQDVVTAHLGPALADELATLGLADHHLFRETIIEVESSWKLMYDTFLEFYHGVYAHRVTLAHLLERNLVHFDPVGRHWRMAAAKKSLATLADAPEETWDVLAHAVVSYDIFPNLAINLHGDHAAVYRIVPDASQPGRCRWHFALLTPEPVTTDKARRYFDKNFDYIVATGREDVAMAESTQRTLASGANDALVYSRFEPVLTWFHQQVAAALETG